MTTFGIKDNVPTDEAILDVFDLFLKVALSAAELITFGHLGAVI